MDRRYPFRFSPYVVIDRFGGLDGTHEVLTHMGCQISQRSIQKWLERGVVPAEAVIALQVYSDRNGGPGVLGLMERKE